MSAYILTTCGTSLLGNVKRSPDITTATEDHPNKQATLAWLRKYEPKDRELGAEINSLFQLIDQQLSNGQVSPPLTIHLLVSDTDDGRWTGEILKSYLQGRNEIKSVDFTVIEGLTDKDPKSFSVKGLRMLVKEAAKSLKDAGENFPQMQRIINATGGYKAQISFAGLIGQALKVPVVYLFETFPCCIEMPPMPVHFDERLWQKHYPLFIELSNEMQVPSNELNLDKVDNAIRSLLEIVEIDGEEYVSLTPILELMHQSFLIRTPPDVVSPTDARTTPEERKSSITTVEHHEVQGEDVFINRLAQIPWVKSIQTIETKHQVKKSKVAPGKSSDISEIWLWYACNNLAKLFRLVTTCENTGHWQYCNEELYKLFK